ncbi:hypothetical protein E2C01_055048 [Portunus trituberculatus]|uniref:Uncharacterized protein n=1 Tax=Portunus trituberculatus TaxID=210409 RepID=A0A5B7GTR9_PORTR|nr:hypothetical protein [Portunus trituberculatus]
MNCHRNDRLVPSLQPRLVFRQSRKEFECGVFSTYEYACSHDEDEVDDDSDHVPSGQHSIANQVTVTVTSVRDTAICNTSRGVVGGHLNTVVAALTLPMWPTVTSLRQEALCMAITGNLAQWQAPNSTVINSRKFPLR